MFAGQSVHFLLIVAPIEDVGPSFTFDNILLCFAYLFQKVIDDRTVYGKAGLFMLAELTVVALG